MIAKLQLPQPIVYPETDGQPMAENTLQFRWIVTIEGGLDAVFRNDPNVFVAGDLFWYPVEGDPTIRTAPDTMVVFGRPKGDRSSYLQWLENDIAPQVVWEVLSPGNTPLEMTRKFEFYERYGVEEYYVYDPDDGTLAGWRRIGEHLREIPNIHGWVSPRLGVKMGLKGKDLELIGPDGKPFASYLDLVEQRERERMEKEKALIEAQQENQRAERERAEKEQALSQAQHEKQRAEQERQRAERLAAQLRQLGVEPAE
jgi:Uma2 family endonuclease